MHHQEQWIWLPENKYKDYQTTIYSGFIKEENKKYFIGMLIPSRALRKLRASRKIK